MRRPCGLKSAVIVTALLLCAFFQLSEHFQLNAQEMVLDYLYRYDCQTDYPDHLMAVQKVSGGRVIIASNRGLALCKLSELKLYGTTDYLDRLVHINARNLYAVHEPYIYVNLNRGENESSTGFSIIELTGDTLSLLNTVDETNVIYEKMFVRGDYLYVTAHSKGIRIFDISDRVNPVMVGRIDSGFVDAFSIHVEGDTAYVADGAGGLKIVDVSDKTAPFIIDGEDLSTAEGTSQDVTFRDGHVYVAAGGAGLAIYPNADLTQRKNRGCEGCAKHFAWVGDYLAMTTMWHVLVFRLDGLGGQELVASEKIARRGTSSQLRTCGGIGSVYGDLLLTANWDFMDVYKLRPASECTKADINCWPQRIRFPPSGGGRMVFVENNSYLPLEITHIIPSDPSVSVTPTNPTNNGILDPGKITSMLVKYDGSAPLEGAIGLYCNDQDEDPFPLQVFGETAYLDPGDPAIDFTFPMLKKDPQGGFTEEQFTLSNHFGKVIWFNLYASW